MDKHFSRRKITNYIGDQLLAGKSHKHLMAQLAAYLTKSNRVNEADYFLKDIEAFLEKRGLVHLNVQTAHDVNKAELAKLLMKFLGNQPKSLDIDHQINKSLVGGITVETPSRYYDGSIANRLQQLRTS